MKLLALAAAAAATLSCAAEARHRKKYDTKFKGYSPDKLNVHIVSHTHDDVGWLKNPDEYFYGANNSIYHAGVQYILDTVVQRLDQNPDRKFTYVEDAYFQRWWQQQDEETQDMVRAQVNNSQLLFANGGWVMHDEAATSYVDMIDQTTLGNRFITREFGTIPQVTWQIDPFGHSGSQQALLTGLSGYDAVYFARIDYQDYAIRENTTRMEMIWRASKSLGAPAQAFTGVLSWHGYCPPPGLNFDLSNNNAVPVKDDARLEGYNVEERVRTFVEDALTQNANGYKGNHIMFTMGCDFQYENADEWYNNLDKLIHYVNANGTVNAFYSTPYQYTLAKNAAQESWSLKTDDFFPYADNPHAYWTGYFTSRPALKGYIRMMSAYLQAARTVRFLSGAPASTNDPSESWTEDHVGVLERAMGVMQHHDAVTGTERQAVAYDYAKRLYKGWANASEAVGESLEELMEWKGAGFQECPLSNVTVCPAAETGESFVVGLVNQQAQERVEYVRLPVAVPSGVASFMVTNATGGTVAAQVYPVSARDTSLRGINGGDTSTPMKWLAFAITIPAYGYTTVFVQPVASTASAPGTTVVAPSTPSQGADVTIGNTAMTATVSGTTGLLSGLKNLADGVSTNIEQSWHWYNGSWGVLDCDATCQANSGSQPSGAYIFRPNATTPFPVSSSPASVEDVVNGPVVSEVRQDVGPWVTQVTRIWGGDTARTEVEWTVGPISIADGMGKEVIHRLDTGLDMDETWRTDSNGREMFTRKYNYRPTWPLVVHQPVSGNYYPVDTAIQTHDVTTNTTLTIVTDRSEGGGSAHPDQLEVMVHRRLLHDDYRGVGEALNETGLTGEGLIVRGTHTLLLNDGSTASHAHRQTVQDVYFRPILTIAPLGSVTPAQWRASHRASFQGVTTSLPINVHLLTVDGLNYGGKVLVRLAHLYEVGEDPVLSAPANVSLSTLFADYTITDATELTLRGNMEVSDFTPLHWTVEGEEKEGRPLHTLQKFAANPPDSGSGLSVTLEPMEIRTFLCDFTSNKA